MEKHVTAVASLQIGLSILSILMGTFIFFILSGTGFLTHDSEARFILTTIGTGIAIFFFIIALPGLIGGIGLFKRQEWARILVLITSALHLLNFPVGTALGIYSIWVLVQDETIDLFRTKAPVFPDF